MPIYEYRCADCRARYTVFFLPPEQPEPRCRRCGSTNAVRLMSRFATVRSDEARLDALADDPDLTRFDESDPRSVARWMKRLGREMGDDLGPEFDEAVEKLEAGGGLDDATGGTTGDDLSPPTDL
ncbi:MAG: zinc ribbon domain-containing protein [Armatimonadota bacterium]|nr:zinc ribbon domain-containing protein [Armatimonadota bacterium]MDR7536144.1 zinc ribbon domain-containing protein [Armatimonadota bacterium]